MHSEVRDEREVTDSSRLITTDPGERRSNSGHRGLEPQKRPSPCDFDQPYLGFGLSTDKSELDSLYVFPPEQLQRFLAWRSARHAAAFSGCPQSW